jgi:hypothetical protein
VKNLETEIEKSLTLKWQLRQNTLSSDQEKFVKVMVEFLKKNPEASISVYPYQYADKEKEHLLFFEAKKKYFLLNHNKKVQLLTEDDSLNLEKMSVKDSLLVHYINKWVNDSMLFTIQEKCEKFVGSANINAKFKQLNTEREKSFMSYFSMNSTERHVTFFPGDNIIPYNGYSFYKISYKGEFPPYLTKAYRKMIDLNNEAPRKQYKKERKKIISVK